MDEETLHCAPGLVVVREGRTVTVAIDWQMHGSVSSRPALLREIGRCLSELSAPVEMRRRAHAH